MEVRMIDTLVSGAVIDQNVDNHQHFSGLFKNGRLMYRGNSNSRNSYNGKCICFSTHAEMDVISKILKVEARTTI